MASRKKDYFGIGYIISVILAIIPPTSWILGILTRFSDGKPVAGILRIFFGFNIVWILDIILMITQKRILRVLNV